MPISIDWGNKVIFVPQNYLTPLGGVLYQLDVEQFRLDLKALEDDEEGMCFPDTHQHATEVTLSGVTYARFVAIINDYTVEFEDGQYVVTCSGANHNIADVKVANQVSLIVGNAAGLIKVETGVSGLTPEESDQLMTLPSVDEIWDELASGHVVEGSFGQIMQRIITATEVKRAVVQDTGATTLKFKTNLSETTNGFWTRAAILFTSGQCKGQIRGAKDYKGDTKEISLETPLSSPPADGDLFIIYADRKFLAPDLDRVLGLVQENFRLKDQVYDSDNNLTSATIRIYATATDAENDVNHIAEYSVAASFDGPGKCTSYLVKEAA